MGKIAKRLARNQQVAQVSSAEGQLQFTFVFDGRRHVHTHRLSASEVASMKELAERHGVGSVHSATIKMAIKCAGILGENMIAKAMLAYMKARNIPDFPDQPEQQTTVFGTGLQPEESSQ